MSAPSKHEQTERIYLEVIRSLKDMDAQPNEAPSVRHELAVTQVKLAELYRVDGRTDDGIRLFEQALAIYQVLGSLDSQRIEHRRRSGEVSGRASTFQPASRQGG